MPNDVFSDVLQLVGAQSVMSGGFAAGGAWALRFPGPDKIRFAAVLQGTCWLHIEGEDAAIRVQTGDVALLVTPRPFVLASDLSVPPLDAQSVICAQPDAVVTLGDGAGCMQLGGHIALNPLNGDFLAAALPPLIYVRATSPHAADLQWLIRKLAREQQENQPGERVAAQQIVQLMFVELLRAHLAAQGAFPPGWLRALADPRLLPSLRLMHGEPGRNWALPELARACAMSVTTFNLRFRASVGRTPLAYLTEWRMRLAERALRESDVAVAAVGRSLGYTSESAFSHAFKRVIGHAPRSWRRAHTATVAATGLAGKLAGS